jgi:hypothetical protein
MNMGHDETDNLFDALCEVLTKHWVKGPNDTPDYVLASYLMSCLSACRDAIKERDQWLRLNREDRWAEWEATKAHYEGKMEEKTNA